MEYIKQKFLTHYHYLVMLFFALFLVQNIISAQNIKTAKEYYNEGKLQQAAWQFHEEKKIDKSQEVYDEIEEILLYSKIDSNKTKTKDDLRGVSETFRVHFHNTKITALFKKATSSNYGHLKYERAAYLLSRELGFNFVPVVVLREIVINGYKLKGSLMYWIDGAKSAKSAGLSYLDKPDQLLLFDAIIGNGDRHWENWMITPQKKIIATDHNGSFRLKYNIWLDRVQEIRNPNMIKESDPFLKLKAISKLRYDEILDILTLNDRSEAWLVREKIIYELQNSVRSRSISLIKKPISRFVEYHLDEPIFTKNSEVEKILLKVVQEHLAHNSLGPRLDGLFSVLIRDNNGNTRSALGGLKVFNSDSKEIERILLKLGFIINKS